MYTPDRIIKPALWDRAQWRGVGYVRRGDDILFVIVFQHRAAGVEIFRDWRERVGPVDTEHQIRIAIIEGEIRGQRPGYSVHISPSVEVIRQSAPPGTKVIPALTRLHRMDTPDSPHLADFKQAFASSGRYQLAPGALTARGFDVGLSHVIEKSAMVFRHASEISTRDLDRPVVVRRGNHAAVWN